MQYLMLSKLSPWQAISLVGLAMALFSHLMMQWINKDIKQFWAVYAVWALVFLLATAYQVWKQRPND